MSRLDDLAIKYGTDKSSLGHNYTVLYEKHLPQKIDKLLEIGVWKGASLKMWREYYEEKGMFYGMDQFFGHELIASIEGLQAVGINCLHGNQDDMWFLETIKDKYSVCIDDGSHHWISQLNTFRRMFVNNIAEGGLYVIEDVFDEPYWGQGIIKDHKQNVKGVFERFKKKGKIESEIITPEESDIICPLIDEVHLYKNIIFIKKK